MTKNLLLLTCATGAFGLLAGASQAATASAASTDTSSSATNVTEIVVTAQHREQSLQKVPVAVAVFTSQERDTIGISTVEEVTNFAPGFSYNPQNTHAYIRGVGRQSVNVTDDSRVANYEDEFYVYSPYGFGKSSLFVQQAQIERGPQNVGGRNAAAGSVDTISVRPTDSPYAELRASGGNFGTYDFEGAVSGQVAPGLDLRLAAFDKAQNDGYYKNLLGGPSEGNQINEWYVEGQLDYKPNDQTEFWARTFFENWDNGGGDAGSRTGYQNGSWDETNLTDANFSNIGGLFINPNYGFANAAINPTAAAGKNPADPTVLSTVLYKAGILDSPTATNSQVFASPVNTTVKLSNFDDFNYIFTYHFPTFDFKYTGGVQGYDYDLNYFTGPAGAPSGNGTNVKQFTLAGGAAAAALNGAFGGAFPGCGACGFGGASLPAGTALSATNLVINPLIQSNYIEDDWWTSHDISFTSTSDSPLQWEVGAFFYYQHYNQPYEVRDTQQPQLLNPLYAPPSAIIGPSASCPIPSGTAGVGICGFQAGLAAPANPRQDIGYFDYNFNVQSEAAYGQLSYKLNDQWKITGDLRYTRDSKNGTENARYIFFAAQAIDGLAPFFGNNTPALDITFPAAGNPTCPTGNAANCTTGALAKGVKSAGVIMPNGIMVRDLGDTSGALTGGAGVEFTPTEDIFTYFRYSRGYEPMSFNAGTILANPEVSPEFLNSYELGYKQSFGKALLIDLAAFYYDYEGLQLPISITNAGLTQAQFINVPKSVSEGVEAEAYWSPVKDLLVTMSYSYDHTAILTGCSGTVSPAGVMTPAAGALCLQDTNDPAGIEPGNQTFPGQIFVPGKSNIFQGVKGNPLPEAPANKFAIDVAYTLHFDPGSLTLSGSYAWRDTTSGSVFNRFYNTAPSWDDFDLRALWKGPNDKYEVIAYVKNVLNSLQYDTGAAGTGLLGNSKTATTAAAGLFEGSVFNLDPPRTFGLEVRYKFF